MAEIIVIGGGPAGMMAALQACSLGAKVRILEPNAKLGRKLYISGKGRCNLCNDCDVDTVMQNTPRNARFLHSALRAFPPEDVKAFFSSRGIALKTERGGRVFPQSDRAADVIDCLFFALRRHAVEIVHTRAIGLVVKAGEIAGVQTEVGVFPADAIIVATGGLSYPLTGSTGDGYALARSVGHEIVPLRASLVPMVEEGGMCARMQGLSLRNVRFRLRVPGKKPVFEEQGELLFTHFGLSGPLVLKASAYVTDWTKQNYVAEISLKPALTEQMLDDRLLRELQAHQNQKLHTVMETLLPRLMIPVLLAYAGFQGTERAHSVTKAERRRLVEAFSSFTIPLLGVRPIEEAIVTGGGVRTSEVQPGSMMSKLCPGLFFAGELLDLDAHTGGFNLQIAWSTGYLAGGSAARYVKKEEQ